jgi:hypothetical protein
MKTLRHSMKPAVAATSPAKMRCSAFLCAASPTIPAPIQAHIRADELPAAESNGVRHFEIA